MWASNHYQNNSGLYKKEIILCFTVILVVLTGVLAVVRLPLFGADGESEVSQTVEKWSVPGYFGLNPTHSDINGDGQQEILVGRYDPESRRSTLDIYDANGEMITGWPQKIDGYDDFISPVVADINNDQKPEIITAGIYSVYIWDVNGSPLSGWPKTVSAPGEFLNPVSIGDVAGDDILEIVVSTSKGIVHVFEPEGIEVSPWPKCLYGLVEDCLGSSPVMVKNTLALADIDGIGKAEIIAAGLQGAGLEAKIFVYGGNGDEMAGWPQSIGSDMIFSAPTAANLDRTSYNEVLIPNRVARYNEDDMNYLEAFKADGNRVFAWPAGLLKFESPWQPAKSSSAAGDIDGDGTIEIFISDNSPQNLVHALFGIRHDRQILPGWPQQQTYNSYTDQFGNSSPALADLNGDGVLEIITGNDDGVEAQIVAFNWDGSFVDGFPLTLPGGDFPLNISSPAVSDLDRDNRLEISLVRPYDSLYVYTLPWETDDINAWPMFRHDAARTGYRNRDGLPAGRSLPGTAIDLNVSEQVTIRPVLIAHTTVKLLSIDRITEPDNGCQEQYPYKAHLLVRDYSFWGELEDEYELHAGPCDLGSDIEVLPSMNVDSGAITITAPFRPE